MKDWYDHLLDSLKYYGVLKNVDTHVLNESTFELLISKKILTFDRNYNNSNSEELSGGVIHKNKRYKFDPSIQKEIYNSLKIIIEDGESSFVNDEIDEIEFSLKRFLTKEVKIQFLYKKYSSIIPSDIYYAIYIEDEDVMAKGSYSDKGMFYQKYMSWDQLIILKLTDQEVIRFLKEDYNNLKEGQSDFLMGLISFDYRVNNDLRLVIQKWKNYYVAKNVGEFIQTKIKELEPIDYNKEVTLAKLFEEVEAKQKYDFIIQLLIKKQIIEKKQKDFKIKIPQEYRGNAHNVFICSIGMQLFNKAYIAEKYGGTIITQALNNTFVNSNVSKKDYDYLKNRCKKTDQYLSHTDFIPINTMIY